MVKNKPQAFFKLQPNTQQEQPQRKSLNRILGPVLRDGLNRLSMWKPSGLQLCCSANLNKLDNV